MAALAGFDVDLYVATDHRTMTATWIGVTTARRHPQEGRGRTFQCLLGGW